MKSLKIAVLATTLFGAGVASADLISNVPLNTSRFEIMDISSLTDQASQGNT